MAACFKQPVPSSTQAESTTETISAVPGDRKPSQEPAAQPRESQHPIPIHEPTGSSAQFPAGCSSWKLPTTLLQEKKALKL